MKEAVKKVRILDFVDVSSLAISRDHYFSNAYIIDLPLDSMPDHVWQDIFEREWRSSRHMWDRKLFVVGDKLRLVTTIDDIEDKFEWVKQVIVETNKDVDEYNREADARKAQIKEETHKALEEEKTGVDAIREILGKRYGAV